MARFLYKARNSQGEDASGVVAAPTVEEAGKLIRAEGKFVINITAVQDVDQDDTSFTLQQSAKRVRHEDVIFFAHQMAVMIETGVPISEALDCIADQAANVHFRTVVRAIAEHVQAGGELSVALKRFPNLFPNVMISLIRASEVSGTMGQMLDRISGYMAKEQRIARQAKGALMYPCFMIVTAVGVTIFLLAFVLPRFATIYASRQAALPAPTQLLLFLSGGLVAHWIIWVMLSAITITATMLFVRTPTGKRAVDYLKLHVPVVRHLYTQLYVTRACRTMGTMISSGVGMLDTVGIVRQVTDNVYYQDLWDQVDAALRQGLQLSDPLFKSHLMPRSIVQMIRSGEKSGRLGQVMSRVAEHAESEFDQAVKNTTQMIEPVMVVVMGALVGFIAISLLLPIFSVSQVMAGK